MKSVILWIYCRRWIFAAFLVLPALLLPAAAQQGFMRDMVPQVIVKPASSRIINDRLTAIGTGQAQTSVALTPWSNGKLNRFYVKAGESVKAGQAIAELDSDNEEIMVERARIELEDARETLERLSRLRDSDTASRVQVINAELALAKAQLNLQDAQLTLERRIIRTPIDGIVGILAVDVGNYVTASTMLARIDNRDKILIDVWLPERFASQVRVGQEVQARVIAHSETQLYGTISAVDNALDEASRTLRVRAEIINEDDKYRAGMSFAVTFAFAGERFVEVDPLAIQWRSEGAYIWLVDEEKKARQAPVLIIQRGSDYVLVSGAVKEGQVVVIQGVHSLREGLGVSIKNLSVLENSDFERPDPETFVIEDESVSSINPP